VETALVAIGLNLVATTIVFLGRVARNYIEDRRGELSGEWIARHLSSGQVVKVDLVICHHRGRGIKGSVNRISPSGEARKKWKFTGEMIEGRIVGHYWPSKRQFQTGSFGVFLMKKGGPMLQGHYFQSKTEFVATDDGIEAFDREGYERFRLRWQRLDRGRTPFASRALWFMGMEEKRKTIALNDSAAADTP
jgi:hypothetical protein